MHIYLHIGPDDAAATRLQSVLARKRDRLAAEGVLYPRSPGPRNHVRLFMAALDPGHVDVLRHNRGFAGADSQAALRDEVVTGLRKEIAAQAPRSVILSAPQLGSGLAARSELERLRDMLGELGGAVTVVLHLDAPARLLVRHYAAQVIEGRAPPLSEDLALCEGRDWWQAALDARPAPAPDRGVFPAVQAPPFWIDQARLVAHWQDVFGAQAVRPRPYDAALFDGSDITDEIRQCFDIDASIGRAAPAEPDVAPSAATLVRGRQFNAVLLRMLAAGDHVVPRHLWRRMVQDMAVPGPSLVPGALDAVSRRFAADCAALSERFPDLGEAWHRAPDPAARWQEADPQMGFRPTQYLLAFRPRIDRATREARKSAKGAAPALSRTARDLLPALARRKFDELAQSPFRPHNRLGDVDEEDMAAPFAVIAPRALPAGSSGHVVIACMKNEAPYIVEWIAHHRAIGIDHFLIYTNDCDDGTAQILDRLQAMGVVTHRDNAGWKGKSPQQHALNQALREPVVLKADWLIHIDVDEFINIRCDNGTLADFLARVPDATNVAMTWRLFGHGGVTDLSDALVTEQFDRCAPSFCPKPHTAWGFKTMLRNIGAYTKLSCHRPNKLRPEFEDKVRWVNGSGHDMTAEAARKGWRNSKKSVGYDLLQLNHYALRSLESFLIKRQRGRALHVDRTIGLNYWIRMDWNDARDVTIKRNLPRLRAEYDRLLADDTLRHWHERGMAWHRNRAASLRADPDFADLFAQARALRLDATERAAYALALDMET